jgi:hypothetical protein
VSVLPNWLLIVGLIWLALVVCWLAVGEFGFAIGFGSTLPRWVVLLGLRVFWVLYLVFLIGWIVPLSIGLYALLQNR